MRFGTKTITIQCLGEHGIRCEVEIEAKVASDGLLAYHRIPTEMIATQGKLLVCTQSSDKWAITHPPTGQYINNLEGDEDRVKAWVLVLASLTDWNERLPTSLQVEQAWKKFSNPIAQITMF